MNVSLTPELAGFVKEQVESGMYHSASEVVRDGLRLLVRQRQDRQARLDRLRAEIALGIEQLDRGEAISGQEVFRELRQRNSQLRKEVQ
jgi:antitoxin ParD1/3/4